MIILPMPSLLKRLCQGLSRRNDPDQFQFCVGDEAEQSECLVILFPTARAAAVQNVQVQAE
jgi:hypothetical protein